MESVDRRRIERVDWWPSELHLRPRVVDGYVDGTKTHALPLLAHLHLLARML